MGKKYVTVYSALREAIQTGVYVDGQKLPSENELMDQFAVSRQTVRLALEKLRQDGLIRSTRGSGTYVHIAPPKLNTRRVAVIAYSITQADFPLMLSGIEAVMSANGYAVQLYANQDNVMTERQILTRLCEDPVDGVFISAADSSLGCANLHLLQRLRSMGTKVVFFGIRYNDPELLDIPVVSMDDYAGIYRIVQNLLKKADYQSVGGIFNMTSTNHMSRLKAIRQAILDTNGLYRRENCFLFNSERDIQRAVNEGIPNLAQQCDLLICTTGVLAVRVTEVLRNTADKTVKTLLIFDDVEVTPCEGVEIIVYKGANENYGEECAHKMLQMIQGHQVQDTLFPWVLK